jgi:hypothetical protein
MARIRLAHAFDPVVCRHRLMKEVALLLYCRESLPFSDHSEQWRKPQIAGSHLYMAFKYA